jgi:hypothetical protein
MRVSLISPNSNSPLIFCEFFPNVVFNEGGLPTTGILVGIRLHANTNDIPWHMHVAYILRGRDVDNKHKTINLVLYFRGMKRDAERNHIVSTKNDR